MRRSASEVIRNLERRVARLEKASRYGADIEVEDGELVDPDAVASEHIDLDDVAYMMFDDDEFRDHVEDNGEDPDDISPTDLDLQVESSSAGRRSRDADDVFYFFIEETQYDFAAIVSVNLDGDPSIDHLGDYSSTWRLFNRWTL